MAFENSARVGVEDDGHRRPGLDTAKIVFGHVGADPHIVDGDQGHHRSTGGGELADIGAQIGDQAGRARVDLGIAQVQLGFFKVAGGAEQLGVFVFVTALLFPCTLHFGLGRGDLADGF
ncbi:hypothetical protein D3C87_1043210 [compost metagenome]